MGYGYFSQRSHSGSTSTSFYLQFSKVPVEWQYKSDGRISDGNTLTHECTLRLGGMETFTEKGNFKIILVRLTSTLCPRKCD